MWLSVRIQVFIFTYLHVKRTGRDDTVWPFCKFTVAVDKLPNFLAAPNIAEGKPGPHHQCSIHLNCESVEVLDAAYWECQQGRPSSRFAKVQN